LESKLADTIRRAPYDTTTLALDTARACVINGPLVEARNIDGQRTTVSLVFVVVQANISTCEGSIGSDQVVKKIPGSSLMVALSGSLSFLLLLEGETVSLFLCLTLLFLALLRR
jgi:hypothetical protein